MLLDTHLLLWWLKDDPRLPTSLVKDLQKDLHSVLISQASLWEMAIKVNPGRLILTSQPWNNTFKQKVLSG